MVGVVGMIINSRLRRWSGELLQSGFLSDFYQNFWATSNIETSIKLPKDVKLYKDQNKRQAFLKPFCYKVMTIFTTHDCRFTTFRRLLVANEYMGT